MVHIGRAARAIGRTLEFDDDGAIDEAVEHRHSERSIPQVFGPCIEINVGDEDSKTDLVSAGDNFVEKVRCLRTLFTLDAVELLLSSETLRRSYLSSSRSQIFYLTPNPTWTTP